MGVSKNRGGPPKSSILLGFPLFSPSILGVFPLFLETPLNYLGMCHVCLGYVTCFCFLIPGKRVFFVPPIFFDSRSPSVFLAILDHESMVVSGSPKRW